MGVTYDGLGLRDRKKRKTRDTNTTIEQIAEAADISSSTFFRYFPTKESVLMGDDLARVTVEALAHQPADLSSVQAFRRALEVTMATLSEADWAFERARLRVMLSVPELRAAQFDEYRRTVADLAAAECRRVGRPADDFEVRVFIGAVSGGLLAVLDTATDATPRMFQALEFIEAGMPVGKP